MDAENLWHHYHCNRSNYGNQILGDKILVKSVLLFAFAFLIVSEFVPAVLADPTIVQVTIDPAKPLPISTITFNATILSNETIDEVRLLVQECQADLCFVYGFNISMEKTANDTYQAQCTLIQEEATQIKYHLNIACNETWYTSNIIFMPLASDAKKNTSQNPPDSVSTPDFEIILVVCAIALVFLWKRKRI